MVGARMGPLFMALLVTVSMSGCGDDEPTSGSGDDGGDPIKIGVNLPLTGSAGNIGSLNLEGVELAAEEINDAGGVNGRPIELVTVDNTSTGGTAATLTERLALQDEVLAVVGSGDSGTSLAIADVANDLEIPQFATQPSSHEFDQPFEWSFRTQADGLGVYEFNTSRLAEVDGATRHALVVTTQTYGQEAKAALPDIAPEHGVEIVGTWEISPGTTNLNSVVSEILASGADAIQEYNFDTTSAVAFFQARRDQGLTVPTAVSGALITGLLQTLSPTDLSAEMNYRAGPFWWDPEGNAEAARFAELYEETHGESLGEDPSGIVFGYTTLYLLLNALQNIELTDDIEADRAALRDALEDLQDVPIPMGSGDATATLGPDDHTVLVATEHGIFTRIVDGQAVPAE